MAAAKIIAFGSRSVAVADEPAARIRNPRYRGLHVLETGATAASLPPHAQEEDTQAQTRRIVAQVEWEIEQQAAREQQAAYQKQHCNVTSMKAFTAAIETESPATAARRLFNAFRAFAKSA